MSAVVLISCWTVSKTYNPIWAVVSLYFQHLQIKELILHFLQQKVWNEAKGLNPNFDDVSVLHVQLSRRLAVGHFGAVEMEADPSLGAGGHLGQVLGEDGSQRCVLKHTHRLHRLFESCWQTQNWWWRQEEELRTLCRENSCEESLSLLCSLTVTLLLMLLSAALSSSAAMTTHSKQQRQF